VPVLRDELAGYRAGLGDVESDELVFLTTKGRPLSMSNVRGRILAASIALANETAAAEGRDEISAALTPHGLRRTFASCCSPSARRRRT
jgi:integrase